MFWLRLAYTVFSVGMGAVLQFLMNGSYAGFVIVFCTALALGFADSFVLMRIKGNTASDARRGDGLLQLGFRGLIRRLLDPLKNKRFVRYLVFTFAFFFFFSMASSYTSLYQYKYLNMSVLFITVYNAVIYIIMIAVTGLWARLERHVGRLKVLTLSAVLMSLDFLVYGFLTKGTLWIIALSPIVNGLGSSGFWACALPYRYDLMPSEGKTVYEGWNGVFFGAAGLLGALAGGILQDLLRPLASGFFSVFQIIYLGACVLAVASAAVFWSAAQRDKAVYEPVTSESKDVSA
jgi:predicted MFS family arabinose efflux permease